MAKTDKPAPEVAVQPGDQEAVPQNPATFVDPGTPPVQVVGKVDEHDVAPRQKERPSSNTTVQRVGDTGFNPKDERRLVRVLKTSYLNGAIFEEGAITYWPRGVENLGPNLAEYKG